MLFFAGCYYSPFPIPLPTSPFLLLHTESFTFEIWRLLPAIIFNAMNLVEGFCPYTFYINFYLFRESEKVSPSKG